MQPDSLDQKILDSLRKKHVSNSQIAKELGVVEGTIRVRIKRLKESGILKIKALINPEILEDKQLAVIGVKVTESKLLARKAKEVSELDDVLSASIVSGHYDIMAEIMVDSNQGLVKFITTTLSQVEGISATESFVFLKSYKKYV